MARSRSAPRMLAFFCVFVSLGAAGARGQVRQPGAVTDPEAVRFLDPGDGRHKLRLLRRGRFSLEVKAAEAEGACSLAKLALALFERQRKISVPRSGQEDSMRHGLLIAVFPVVAALAAAVRAEDKPLFNGNDLTGWTQVGPGKFEVENGVMKTTGGMGLLVWNGAKVGNSVLRVVYKTEKKESNAGVFIRIPEKPTEPWMPVHKGYEVQIDDSGDENHVTGVLYSLTKAKSRPSKPGEWNTLEITLDGPHTLVTVNGELVTDYTEGEPVPAKKEWYEPERGPRPSEGYIGLQNHGDKDVVFFKEVTLRPLGSAK